MKGFYISLFFILIIYSVNGQEYANKEHYLIDSLIINKVNKNERLLIDSCLTEFHSVKADSSKINAINYIVESCYDNSVWPKYNQWIYDFSAKKLEQSENSELNLYFLKAKASSINNFGYLNQIEGKNEKATQNYSKSLNIYQQINDSIGIANTLNNIGSIYYYSGNSLKSLKLYHESLNIRKLIHDDFGVANSLNNIGNIYREEANYPEAIEYFLESLKIRLSLKNKGQTSTLYHNIGLCYLDLDDTKNAIHYFKKALEADTKSANTIGIATALSSAGRCHQKKSRI